MFQNRSILDIMRERSSWRSYSSKMLPGDVEGELRDELRKISSSPGPFGNRARFVLVSGKDMDPADFKKFGTYGFIRGVRNFITGAIPRGDHDLEDYGYLMEKNILHATGMGLGTCWLGGTFSRGTFADAVGLQENELLPAVTPVGYRADRRGMLERVIRRAIGSRNRKSGEELFFDGDFTRPLDLASAGRWAPVLEMVRIAPSATNKQPWRLVRSRDGKRWDLILHRTKGYHKEKNILGMLDLQRVDMGIACCHFELAARESGLGGAWSAEPGPPEGLGLTGESHWVACWQ